MRTGSVFSINCSYYGDQVEAITGTPENSQVYKGPENDGLEYTFCKRCGSTVYWEFSVMRPMLGGSTLYGIAIGCFVDSEFPKPTLDVFDRDRHHWVDGIDGVEPYEIRPPMEVMFPSRVKG